MRLIVFSDLHGNYYALEALKKRLEKMSYDYLVFCGDIFGYYYNQKEIINSLTGMESLVWLKGNHDEYFLNIYAGKVCEDFFVQQYGHSYANIKARYTDAEVQIIASHKSKYVIEENHCRIGIFHGTPEDSLEGRLYPDKEVRNKKEYQKYDVVILGHTHCRMVRKEGHTLIVNPGSLGQPRDGKGFGFAEVDTDSQRVIFHSIEIDKTNLYQQIEQYDPELKKLKEVLERRA